MDYLEIRGFLAVEKIIFNDFSFQGIRKMRPLIFFSDLIEHKLGLRVQLYIKASLLWV